MAAAEPMVLGDLAQATADWATTAGILVGAVWAYYRFVRGRTFRDRLVVAIEASVTSHEGGELVSVHFSVTNPGASRVVLHKGDENLPFGATAEVHALGERVWTASAEDWAPPVNAAVVEWSEPKIVLILEEEVGVEPNEELHGAAAIPFVGGTGDPAIAYRVTVRIVAARRTFGVGRHRAHRTFRAESIVPSALPYGRGHVDAGAGRGARGAGEGPAEAG